MPFASTSRATLAATCILALFAAMPAASGTRNVHVHDDGESDGFSYRLVVHDSNGTSSYGNAWGDDWDFDDDGLYFELDGKRYVVHDRATLDRALEATAAMRELGKKQGELGRQQGELGRVQGQIGRLQARAGALQARLGVQLAALVARGAGSRGELDARDERERAEIEGEMHELASEQRALAERERPFAERQTELGRRQEALGKEQRRASEQAREDLRALAERAVEQGTAESIPR
jgi:hypothetical protein